MFSWIIGHPLGLIHAVLRTVLVTSAWWLLPNHRSEAIAFAVVITYGYAILALATRPRGAGQSSGHEESAGVGGSAVG